MGAGFHRGEGAGPPGTGTPGQGQVGGTRALTRPTGELTGGGSCSTTRKQAKQQHPDGLQALAIAGGSLSSHLW